MTTCMKIPIHVNQVKIGKEQELELEEELKCGRMNLWVFGAAGYK